MNNLYTKAMMPEKKTNQYITFKLLKIILIITCSLIDCASSARIERYDNGGDDNSNNNNNKSTPHHQTAKQQQQHYTRRTTTDGIVSNDAIQKTNVSSKKKKKSKSKSSKTSKKSTTSTTKSRKKRRRKKKKRRSKTAAISPSPPLPKNDTLTSFPSKLLSSNAPSEAMTTTTQHAPPSPSSHTATTTPITKETTTMSPPPSIHPPSLSQPPSPSPPPLKPKKQQRPPPAPPLPKTTTTPWIRSFLSNHPRDALLPIPPEFLSDGFNLLLLPSSAPSSSLLHQPAVRAAALRLILSPDYPNINDDELSVGGGITPSQLQNAAVILYTLAHARYITSPRGLDTIRRMMLLRQQQQQQQQQRHSHNANNTPLHHHHPGPVGLFGRCPRIACDGMPLLPYGRSEVYGRGVAMRYCPCCGELLHLWETGGSKVDGSAWGRSFCFLLLMVYGEELFPKAARLMSGGGAGFRGVMRRDGGGWMMEKRGDWGDGGLIEGRDEEREEEMMEEEISPIPKIFGMRVHPSATICYPLSKRRG